MEDKLDPLDEDDKICGHKNDKSFGLLAVGASVGMAAGVFCTMDPMCLFFSVVFLALGIVFLSGHG